MPAEFADDLDCPQYHVTLLARKRPPEVITQWCTKFTHYDTSKDTPKMDLEVDNGDDWAIGHPFLLAEGSILQVSYGYASSMRRGLEFVVKDHSGNSKTVRITALEKKEAKSSRKEVSRVWSSVRRSDVVRDVMRTMGITGTEAIIDDTVEVLDSVTQTEPNWPFLARLAGLEGFEFFPDQDGLHWHLPRREGKPTHVLKYVKNLVSPGIITDYSFGKLAAGRPGKIKLKGRNAKSKKRYEVVASAADTKNLHLWSNSGDGRTPEEGDSLTAGVDGFELTKNVACRTEAEAKSIADAAFRDYRYNALKLTLFTLGDPTFRKGKPIVLYNMGPAFDGTYYLNDCVHQFDAGYLNQLSVSRDGTNLPAGGANSGVQVKDIQFTSLDWENVTGAERDKWVREGAR